VPPIHPRNLPRNGSRFHLLSALLAAVAIAISLAAVWGLNGPKANTSLLGLSNLVGPTSDSLLHGSGLTACTERMGTPRNSICFHAGRMPVASLVVAAGIRMLGDHFLRVDLFKTLLLLLPLELAIYLACLRLPRSPRRQSITVVLLLAPFVMTPFLADVVNLQVEEGYTYSLLALAIAILFYAMGPSPQSQPRFGIARATVFALSTAGLYLSKSGMLFAVVVLVLSYILLERRVAERVLVLLLVAAAPAGWALHQHSAGGRYSIGTSLDGINLHKGNNPGFLAHYPPPPGVVFDSFDAELNQGLHFSDEWTFNDYHRRAAWQYLRTHPAQTAKAELRKLFVLFLSIHKVGSSENTGRALKLEDASLLAFRLLFWAALLAGLYTVFRRGSARPASAQPEAVLFLSIVVATTLPSVLAFANTRHVSVLIYPSALFLCLLLQQNPPLAESSPAQS